MIAQYPSRSCHARRLRIHNGMLRAIGRNTVLFGALAVAAAIGGLTAHFLLSERGAYGPTVLQAQSIPAAILAVVITLVVATALAIVVGRVCNTAVGMFMLGGGIFGMAWGVDTIGEVVHGGSLGMLGVETAIWAVLALAASIIVFKFAGPLRDVSPREGGKAPDAIFSLESLKAAAAGVLVLPAVWLLAQSPMKGQVIGAVFCGAMAAGMVGRIFSPHVQPVLLFASPVLFGAIGHIIGAVLLKTPADQAFVDGTFPALLLPTPVDYATGSLMGVSFGLGLAKSYVHHEEDAER